MRVVRIDEERIRFRLGEEPTDPSSPPPCASVCNEYLRRESTPLIHDEPLQSIREEDEDEADDYPFDD